MRTALPVGFLTRRVHDAQARSKRLRLLARQLCVPANFGGRDGPCVSNKASILAEVDTALGRARPPDVEVLLTDHVSDVSSPLSRALHAGVLRFGHVAVRYTTSDGVQRVMNILGDLDAASDARMVNFVPPAEYLYGTRGYDTFAQQGGVYNRPFVGLRIERVAPGATDAMHAYYLALDARSHVGHSAEVPGGVADAAGGEWGASGSGGGAGGSGEGAGDGQAGAGGGAVSAAGGGRGQLVDGSADRTGAGEGRAIPGSDETAGGRLGEGGGGASPDGTGGTGPRGAAGASPADHAPPATTPQGHTATPEGRTAPPQVTAATPPAATKPTAAPRPPAPKPRRAFGGGAARFQLVEARLSTLMKHLPLPIASVLERLLHALERAHRGSRIAASSTGAADHPRGSPHLPPVHPQASAASRTSLLGSAPHLPTTLTEAGEGARRAAAEVRASTYAAGNCAQWTSSGLEFAGLLRRTRLFPKAILIELLESETLRHQRGGNVNVVYYAQVGCGAGGC